MKKIKLGVIGIGNMGASILEGVLARRLTIPSRVWIYDKDTAKASAFALRHHVRKVSSAAELRENTDVVLLAMKPQDFPAFAAENMNFIRKNSCVISILAGMTTEKIAKALIKLD